MSSTDLLSSKHRIK